MHGLFRWSSKWWPGTIPLAILWGIAAWSNTVPLETDLAARSTTALKDTVLDKTQITVDGRDVSFAADAFSENEPFRKAGLFSSVKISRMRRGQWNPAAAPKTAEGN